MPNQVRCAHILVKTEQEAKDVLEELVDGAIQDVDVAEDGSAEEELGEEEEETDDTGEVNKRKKTRFRDNSIEKRVLSDPDYRALLDKYYIDPKGEYTLLDALFIINPDLKRGRTTSITAALYQDWYLSGLIESREIPGREGKTRKVIMGVNIPRLIAAILNNPERYSKLKKFNITNVQRTRICVKRAHYTVWPYPKRLNI